MPDLRTSARRAALAAVAAVGCCVLPAGCDSGGDEAAPAPASPDPAASAPAPAGESSAVIREQTEAGER